MKRALMQFDEDTYQKLRRKAFREERSISSVVREMVVKGLEDAGGRTAPRRVGQFLSVSAGRSRQGRLSPVSERHDQALTSAFEK
jgi:hypothetical protein